METLEKKIEDIADLIIEAKSIVVLTGAGMSTESGIADLRSPETGLWTKDDPMNLLVSILSSLTQVRT